MTRPFFERLKAPSWFPYAIAAGVALALLLLVNAVANYRMVSRKLAVEHLRRGLAERSAKVVRATAHVRTAAEMDAMLSAAQRASGGSVAWIQVRNPSDAVLSQAGLEAGPSFTAEFVRSSLRGGRPAVRVVNAGGREVVVEAYPLRLPASFGGPVFTLASERVASPGVIEIAGYLDQSRPPLWTLRRSFGVNVLGGLLLLGSLVVMGTRYRAYAKGLELQRDVEAAAGVQRDWLPGASAPAGFEVAAHWQPAGQVGGDFYDVFAAAGGSGFVLGDVSGKGVPAAMLTGVVWGAIRSDGPEFDAEGLNRLLCERAGNARFVTLFWSWFDPASATLRYVNAGHYAGLLLRAGGAVERLDEGGPVLGLLASARYARGETQLGPGDRLVLYSDGIVEAANETGEEFGEDRLAAALPSGGAAGDTCRRVLDNLQNFCGAMPPGDDRTMLVIRYNA